MTPKISARASSIDRNHPFSISSAHIPEKSFPLARDRQCRLHPTTLAASLGYQAGGESQRPSEIQNQTKNCFAGYTGFTAEKGNGKASFFVMCRPSRICQNKAIPINQQTRLERRDYSSGFGNDELRKFVDKSKVHQPNHRRRIIMKAARIHEYGKPVVPEDVPVPDMQPDEILVEVKACGMCRSDAQLEFAVFAARSTVCLNGFGFIKERFNQGPLFIS